jgi:hypothetical protein
VPIIGFTDSYPYAIIIPYCQGGPLRDLLDRHDTRLDGAAKQRIAKTAI